MKEEIGEGFAWALSCLQLGFLVSRYGWNAPGQYVAYQAGYPDGIPINANTARATGIAEGTVMRFRPYLMLKTADGSFVPWTPTQSDMLTKDWYRVELHRDQKVLPD